MADRSAEGCADDLWGFRGSTSRVAAAEGCDDAVGIAARQVMSFVGYQRWLVKRVMKEQGLAQGLEAARKYLDKQKLGRVDGERAAFKYLGEEQVEGQAYDVWEFAQKDDRVSVRFGRGSQSSVLFDRDNVLNIDGESEAVDKVTNELPALESRARIAGEEMSVLRVRLESLASCVQTLEQRLRSFRETTEGALDGMPEETPAEGPHLLGAGGNAGWTAS